MRHKAARLPAELTDRVIDHLHSDKLALAKCSLVCKDWLPASRYHFFQISDIRLTGDNIHSFAELLNSPASTFFGHALCVILSGPPVDSNRYLSASRIFDTISHHLFRLKIKSLALTSVVWNITGEKQEELFKYFATISTLDLHSVLFSEPSLQPFDYRPQFIQFISSFLSLERLYLCEIFFPTCDVDPIPPFTLSPLLRFVDLTLYDMDPPSFTWFLSAVHFPPLDSLTISNIEHGDMSAIQAVLQSLGSSLHDLTLSFADPGTFISGHWCISSL